MDDAFRRTKRPTRTRCCTCRCGTRASGSCARPGSAASGSRRPTTCRLRRGPPPRCCSGSCPARCSRCTCWWATSSSTLRSAAPRSGRTRSGGRSPTSRRSRSRATCTRCCPSTIGSRFRCRIRRCRATTVPPTTSPTTSRNRSCPVGHIIILTAIPYGNPRGGFILKFNENGSKRQALHFNPRFDPHYVVVRNSHASDALDFRQEERSGGFPFIIDQQFKLAIGLAEQEFRFAINGSRFETYAYRAPRQLDVLNGFRIECTGGLQLEVTAVDHYYSGVPSCAGFEEYSDPDVDIM
ncbi:uncharacterized protein LOC121589509 [Anopheles merus]|uniref:uncharacterized protein LOC121589509 n=1 Tax=Anopheles merus TaxID=30066 RepID=UPI001BE422F5|nr:uncharacterized protein LOC121589509 [Anopheles merus]